jgi:hypothetical protein
MTFISQIDQNDDIGFAPRNVTAMQISERFDRVKGRALLAALIVFGVSFSSAAQANDLAPRAARQVKIGPISALTYYTVETDGFRVVTTIQPEDADENDFPARPVRFVVTLAAGQETMVSVPRDAGREAIELKIARVGDAIQIGEANGGRCLLQD